MGAVNESSTGTLTAKTQPSTTHMARSTATQFWSVATPPTQHRCCNAQRHNIPLKCGGITGATGFPWYTVAGSATFGWTTGATVGAWKCTSGATAGGTGSSTWDGALADRPHSAGQMHRPSTPSKTNDSAQSRRLRTPLVHVTNSRIQPRE